MSVCSDYKGLTVYTCDRHLRRICSCSFRPFVEAREHQLTSNPAFRAAALIVHFAYLWRICVDILVYIRPYMYVGYKHARLRTRILCLHYVCVCVSEKQWRTQEFCSRGGGSKIQLRTKRTGIWGALGP